jgi:hypothetical protein
MMLRARITHAEREDVEIALVARFERSAAKDGPHLAAILRKLWGEVRGPRMRGLCACPTCRLMLARTRYPEMDAFAVRREIARRCRRELAVGGARGRQ